MKKQISWQKVRCFIQRKKYEFEEVKIVEKFHKKTKDNERKSKKYMIHWDVSVS